MENNICQTCLSKDRRLIPLAEIYEILKKFIKLEMNDKNGGVCWECRHIVLKFHKFKTQVLQAQESIKLGKESKSLSNLLIKFNNYYDYQYNHYTDPLTQEVEIKIDVKEEFVTKGNCSDDEKNDLGEALYDEKPEIHGIPVNVFIDIPKNRENVINNTEDVNFDNTESSEDNTNSNRLNLKFQDIIVATVNAKCKLKNKNKRKKRNSLCTDADEEELENKFSMVMYSEEEMQKHREEKRNHPNFKKIAYKCDSCVLGFTKKSNLENHIEKRHNENLQYTCDVCLTRFSQKKPLARHITSHYARFRCALCAYETCERWCALQHCRSRHAADTPGSLHCPQCNAETSNREELSEHIGKLHPVYCDECREKFKSKNSLRIHKRRIHGVKRDFVCEICTKTFLTKSRLESHAVNHNSTIAKKLAFCTKCNIQYKNIYVYRNHLKNSANHSEKSYPCPECDKKFVSKEYWTKHYNFYHLKKSKFNCEVCNKMFISDWRLKQHNQTKHGFTRTRDYPCNICGKKFFTATTLRGHQLTHSSQRSFMCEDCGDTFKQRAALYTHTRLVHKGGKRHKT